MIDLVPLAGPTAAPAAGGAPLSMVVLLHGYGSNGDDLIGLAPYWRDALPRTIFLAPNAPQVCPGAHGGYQWWPLTDLSPEGRASGVRQSGPALNAYLDAQLARYGLSDGQLALVGFSQGTMMALQVGPRRTKSLAGVLGYSGMLVDPGALAAEVRTKPPVLLIHGDADPMVPFTAMSQAEAALAAAGFKIETHTARGLGHGIDDAGLRLGQQFLGEVLAQTAQA
jgi:phospholipase/carboxylesterase